MVKKFIPDSKFRAWTKNNLREIQHTKGRFIAILVIIMLGVGFFSGLLALKPAMIKGANDYINDDSNMYDYRFIATIGFTEDDVNYYKTLDGVTMAEGSYSIDFFADTEYESALSGTSDDERILKAYSITKKINKIKLVSGRMPTSSNECLVDDSAIGAKAIGTTIRVSSRNSDSTKEFFAHDKFIVVGTCCSVNYLNRTRGTTTLEGGTLDGFIYLLSDAFSSDRMTELLIKTDASGDIFSDEYDNAINDYADKFQSILDERTKEDYENLRSDARRLLDEAWDKYDSEYDSYLETKREAEQQLDDTLETLNNGKAQLEEAKAQLADAKQAIEDGEKEYRDGIKAYDEGLAEYTAQREAVLSQLYEAQGEIDANRRTVETALSLIDQSDAVGTYNAMVDRLNELSEIMDSIEDHESLEYLQAYEEYLFLQHQIELIDESGLPEMYRQLVEAQVQLDEAQAELDRQRETAMHEFERVKAELDRAKSQLDDAAYELNSARLQYTEGLITYYESKSAYDAGYAKYEQAKLEADTQFDEAEQRFSEAKAEIDAQEKEFDDFFGEAVRSYSLDRSKNSGYISYENDASIVEGIARVIPLIFFIVAALVCTTTMTRMVDEHRTQIGTLKAIGYSDGIIIMKYIGYSGSAALIGCVIGFFGGSILIPKVIWNAYKMLYDFGEIGIVFDYENALISLIISLVCTAGATFAVCKKELTEMPADLIRPKAPKPGRRILLERIPFIWNHLSFLNKVAARNILRYTRRLIMMLVGIGGCTALILVGFGVHDSISNVVNDQFTNITRYDYEISFADSMTAEEQAEFTESCKGLLKDCVFVISDSVNIKTGKGELAVNIVATSDPDVCDIVRFSLDGEVVPYPGDGGIIINEKLSTLTKAKIGDYVEICLNDEETIEARVDGIFENYVNNYMFMNEKTYKDLFNNDAGYKTAYATVQGDDIYDVSARLYKEMGVNNVSVSEDIRKIVDDMMKSMNYIVGVIIVSACSLAFVVAYNLGNISVVERTREIATLKVLGFQLNETTSYVSRENIIITIIGSLLGLPCGYLLNRFVMTQVNIDFVTFDIKVLPLSYLYAFAISMLLSLIVTLLLRRKIAAINPAESLKSVD